MPVSSPSIERQVVVHRRLLWTFIARDLRSRFAGSGLGVFWSVIHPLVILALYLVVFSTLSRGVQVGVRGHLAGYAVFLCPALIAWNWMSESLIGACNSVTANASLIRRVAFPAGILPAAAVLAGLPSFGASMLVFLGFEAAVGAFAPVSLPYLVLAALLQAALMIGPAYLLAALNVAVRDTAQVVVAGLQFVFWATPVVYQEEALVTAYPWVKYWFAVNPVAHLVQIYRDALTAHQGPDPASVAYLLAVATVAYLAGRTLFGRSHGRFADQV